MTFASRVGGLCTVAAAATFAIASPCLAQGEAQQGSTLPAAAAQDTAPTFKPEELDALVAPIALYPDPLLAQIFMASTYPLEVVEAARWQKEHPDLKDKALEDALQSQTWDPSVKSLVAFPQVLTMMNEKLDWTQKLGDACLAQQDHVMLSVQRLRNKAKAEGNLETTKEQIVTVQDAPVQVDQTVNVQQAPPPPQTIVIQPADPQVVYVPTYNPTTVYGSFPPAYPPYSYYPPGYVAATSIMSFGAGMMVGAALWGDCDWDDCCNSGGDNIKVNVNNYNNFNKTDIKNSNWNHNAEHRKGVGYRDAKSQERFGKGGQQSRNQAAARDSFRGRAESGRQEMARTGTDRMNQKTGAGGQRPATSDRAGANKRPGNAGGARDRPAAASRERGGQQRQQAPQRSGAGANRPTQRSGSAFSGMGSGQSARQQSARGRSSRSGGGFGGGGGGRRGGGGGGGGRRGGGGGRR